MSTLYNDADVDWVFGIHGVRALLDTPDQVRRLLVAEGRRSREVEALVHSARDAGVRVERAPKRGSRIYEPPRHRR